MLAALPDENKLVSFDRRSRQIVSLAETIESLSPEDGKATVRLFVESIAVDGEIKWSPAVRPFFAAVVGDEVERVSPQGFEP